ncbi:MAG: hypothetical protein COT55_01060 [Candidatus Diapherotrites archaeon CG09_land_8_20_14_0_10_32_12]|nr:MAG: hypothetical protein COT55_01060 [Candidatus Diapherotrites archaeon CG09_land_8_20_14_0_10_32_12]
MAEWAVLFQGIYDQHDLKVSILDSFILSELYSSDKKSLVLNVVYVGSADGDLESFAETLPKDNMLYLMHNSKSTRKFFCLTVPSTIIDVGKVEMDREITKQIQMLAKTRKIVLDIADTYDIKITDLHESSKEIQNMFFINPLNIFKTLRRPEELQKIDDVRLNFGHMISFGKYKSSEEFSSDELDAFRKTMIFGAKENQKKMLYDFIEEFSLSAIPVIVFDFENIFSGLKSANPHPKEVKAFNSNSEPTGFPIENLMYDGSENSDLHVDLSLISIDSFCELFGIVKEYKEIFKRAYESNPEKITDLISAIQKVSPDEQLKEYDIYLAKRMAQTLNLMYPNLFVGKVDVISVQKVVANKIGKITLITITGNDVEKALIVQNILSLLGSVDNVCVVLTDGWKFCPKSTNSIQNEITNSLLSFNCYFAISATDAADLNDNLQKYKSAQINVIDPNDIVLKIGNSSPQRIMLRPTLSNM